MEPIDYENLGYLPPPPNIFGITIFGKSNCPRCEEIKTMLDESEMLYKYVNCDSYLEVDKEKFKDIMFEYMRKIPPKRVLYFPVCFVEGEYFPTLSKFFYTA